MFPKTLLDFIERVLVIEYNISNTQELIENAWNDD